MSKREGPKVLIIQRRMTHYRVPFFEALRSELSERGYSLRLGYGEPTKEETKKNDTGILPWGTLLNTTYLISGKVCWQPFGQLLRDTSMVVIGAENKLIYNLYVQMARRDVRVAIWGHGGNLQGNRDSWRERFKRTMALQTDWWFGYTAMSIPLIESSGFPGDRITIVNNSSDTGKLATQFNSVKSRELIRLKEELNLNGRCVGIYVGSLYREKRIGFMLEAAKEIKQRVPEFEFLLIGSGEQKRLIEQFCAIHRWAHYLGPQNGQVKASFISLSHVMINPGAVGLGILDSLVCRVPMVTTDCGIHGPEIAYLENEGNGLITPNNLSDYVAGVATLLQDEDRLSRLRAGCASSGSQYTIENMAIRFSDGIERCLATPLYRGTKR